MRFNSNKKRYRKYLLEVLFVACFPISAFSADGIEEVEFVAVPNHPTVLWRDPVPSSQGNRRIAVTDTLVKKRFDLAAQSAELASDARLSSASASAFKNRASIQNLPKLTRHNVDMFVGEVQVLTKRKIERVAVGRGSILRADVLESGELLVIAESAGSSSLRLWFENGQQSDYNIRVTEHDPETRFRMEKMVRMRVRMIEFRKSALTRLGIDWADAVNGPTFGVAADAVSNSLYRPIADGFDGLPLSVDPVATYFGIASSLTSRINAMATEGDARILAEPVLSGTNGGVASFLAGGEVPYPTIGSNGEPIVDFKEYGIRLEVQPRVDSGGNVRANIQTEISQLDPAVTVQGAPGLLTRRANTEVNVKSGQTIVISGLLSSEASKDIAKLPGIGRLPVLGRLFRSDNIRNNVSELVIFITPEVIEPTSVALNGRDEEFYQAAEREAREARESRVLRQ